MLRLSRKVEYALIALLYMSRKSWRKITTTRELSQRFNIPLELMGKVLQSLTRDNLIISVQGPKGGYFLHKPIDCISMSAVIESVDGPISFVNCISSDLSGNCGQVRDCNLREPMRKVQNKLGDFFATISVKDLKTSYSV